jgi:hypothetical protein
MRRLVVLIASAAAVLVAGCGASTHTGGATGSAPGSRITQLKAVSQLRSVFNAHDGTPRLLVLASPT